jgi:hypothetical protein
MKKWTLIALAVLATLIVVLFVVSRLTQGSTISVEKARNAGRVGCRQVAAAFIHHQSGQWLTVAAPIVYLLPDAHGRSTHQRFVLRCPSGQTVLIENNVDVGERVPATIGERVVVHGQYIWNPLGGLVHDTHHSTDSNPDGWILAQNRVYH